MNKEQNYSIYDVERFKQKYENSKQYLAHQKLIYEKYLLPLEKKVKVFEKSIDDYIKMLDKKMGSSKTEKEYQKYLKLQTREYNRKFEKIKEYKKKEIENLCSNLDFKNLKEKVTNYGKKLFNLPKEILNNADFEYYILYNKYMDLTYENKDKNLTDKKLYNSITKGLFENYKSRYFYDKKIVEYKDSPKRYFENIVSKKFGKEYKVFAIELINKYSMESSTPDWEPITLNFEDKQILTILAPKQSKIIELNGGEYIDNKKLNNILKNNDAFILNKHIFEVCDDDYYSRDNKFNFADIFFNNYTFAGYGFAGLSTTKILSIYKDNKIIKNQPSKEIAEAVFETMEYINKLNFVKQQTNTKKIQQNQEKCL